MKKLQTTITAVAMLVMAAPTFAADFDQIPTEKCADFVTPDGTLIWPRVGLAFTWLVGYLDGISAAANLDSRLMSVRDMAQVAPVVMTYCSKKQDDSLMTATTDIAAMMINMQPGPTLDLR